MREVRIVAIAGAALGALAVTAVLSVVEAEAVQRPAPASDTLCRGDERVVFQCRVGSRTVSLCAASPWALQRSVQYRFGRPGRIELAYPAQGSEGLSWARTGYSGGGEMQVNFSNGEYRYALYSRVVRTRFDGVSNDPRFSSGVAVIRDNRIVSDRPCTDTDMPWIAEAPTERLLPEGRFTAWWDLDD